MYPWNSGGNRRNRIIFGSPPEKGNSLLTKGWARSIFSVFNQSVREKGECRMKRAGFWAMSMRMCMMCEKTAFACSAAFVISR